MSQTKPTQGEGKPSVQGPPRSLRPEKDSLFHRTKKTDQSVRERYLDYLERDVGQRLKASIHRARFLDIGVDEKLNATVPWYYKALEGQQQFGTFDEAFVAYEGRVLLLGPPGSGKTTTLLNLAQKLISEAQKDQTAPVPLLFNLSKFSNISPTKVSEQLNWLRKEREPSEENPARVFEQWLIQMLIEMPVEGLNKHTAQQWVNSGEVALLLDGLDEVNESYVVKLAEIVNQTYFREHPLQILVVCSRIIEYQPLEEDKDARLRLNGAVTLQPPTHQQIDSYLEDAQALALRDALRDDDVLYEMAQTPLTLSMMTLAYGGEAPTDIPHDVPFLERRRKLLDTYVERMVQRTARREHIIPFDLNPDNDVPPRYPLRQTNHYLGWLAIKLSERMRTLFPLSRFYSFLSEQPQEVEARSLGSKYIVILIAAWLIAAFFNAGLLISEGLTSHLLWLAVVPLLAPLTVLLLALDVTEIGARLPAAVSKGTMFLGVVFFLLCFGFINRAVLTLVPLQLHSGVTSVLILALAGFILLLRDSFDDEESRDRIRNLLWRSLKLLFALTLAASIAAVMGSNVKFVPYGIAFGSCVILFFWLRRASEFEDTKLWKYILSFIGITAVLIVSGVALTFAVDWLIGSHDRVALAVAVTIVLGFLITKDKWVGTPLSMGLAVLAGNLAGGASVAALAAVGVMLFHANWLKAPVARILELFLLNPLLRVTLAIAKKICFRYQSFLDYATDTMLLKRVGTEYEFVHRLLRDHFAIRELIPALYQAEGEKRIAVIQRLSRQGDSSFDALANLTTHADSHIRRAAIEGLGRIGIPKVVSIMQERVRIDPDENVRAAVVQSLFKFKTEEKYQIFIAAMRDPSPEVRRATVANSRDSRLLGAALYDEADIVFRQALISIAEAVYFYPPNSSDVKPILPRLSEALLANNTSVNIGAALVLNNLYEYGHPAITAGEDQTVLVESVIPALVAKCKESNAKVREAMIKAISTMISRDIAVSQQAELKAVLMEALKDTNSGVRNNAVHGLANLQDAEALAALRDSLKDKHLDHRKIVIRELGRVRDGLAVPALMKELTNPKLRYQAAAALGSIADQSVVPQLLRWLEDERYDLQVSAIMTIDRLKVNLAGPKLRQLLRRPADGGKRLGVLSWSQPEDLRPYAAVALGSLGDVDSLPDLCHLSTNDPLMLLVAKIRALRRFPPEVNVEKKLLQKIKELHPTEEDDLTRKISNVLRGGLIPEYRFEPTLLNLNLAGLLSYLLEESVVSLHGIWKETGSRDTDDLAFFM